jgi:hypothetical protein
MSSDPTPTDPIERAATERAERERVVRGLASAMQGPAMEQSASPVPQVREDGAKRLPAVRKLYLEWTASTNPVLLAAAGRLREAAGFVLTDQEREQIQRRQR